MRKKRQLLKDYAGCRFGTRVVTGFAGRVKGGNALWNARCNRAKNTHFTYDEWKELGAVI